MKSIKLTFVDSDRKPTIRCTRNGRQSYPAVLVSGYQIERPTNIATDNPSVPTNCRFEVDDVEDEWVYSYKFDYVHARHMVGSIKNFPGLFAMVYENLNPGGYVEFQDYYVKLQAIDDSLNGTALQRWNNMLNEALSFTGRSGMNSAKYKRQMEEAGFQDVVEHKFSVSDSHQAAVMTRF